MHCRGSLILKADVTKVEVIMTGFTQGVMVKVVHSYHLWIAWLNSETFQICRVDLSSRRNHYSEFGVSPLLVQLFYSPIAPVLSGFL